MVLLALLGLAAAWWLGFLTPEPQEVSLAETVTAVKAAAEPEPPAAEPEPAAAEPAATAVEIPSGSTLLAGAWQVEPGDATFVGYRADSRTGEAVGRTRGVTGVLVASDTTIETVDISADMSVLASDSRLRDEHLGTDGLETQRYTTSRFVLTEPIGIGPLDTGIAVSDGATATFTAVGELTVKQATVLVAVSLDGTIVGDKLVVVGSTELDLNDFDATISDIEFATLEFSLVFIPQT